jgi:hypothetical protein
MDLDYHSYKYLDWALADSRNLLLLYAAAYWIGGNFFTIFLILIATWSDSELHSAEMFLCIVITIDNWLFLWSQRYCTDWQYLDFNFFVCALGLHVGCIINHVLAMNHYLAIYLIVIKMILSQTGVFVISESEMFNAWEKNNIPPVFRASVFRFVSEWISSECLLSITVVAAQYFERLYRAWDKIVSDLQSHAHNASHWADVFYDTYPRKVIDPVQSRLYSGITLHGPFGCGRDDAVRVVQSRLIRCSRRPVYRSEFKLTTSWSGP